MKPIHSFFLAALCVFTTGAAAQEPGRQVPLSLQTEVVRRVQLDYLLYVPADYRDAPAKRWPLMLFLHGAGERGTNLDLVTIHGPPKLIKAGTNFPFIVVSPQCPPGDTWQTDALLALVDAVCARHRIDTNRIYVTGLSMGGFGTWALGLAHPQRFAAIAPICGGGDRIRARLTSGPRAGALRSLGVWAFHGGKDPVVPLEESERMVDAFKRLGADARLKVYPEAQHDSWTETYLNPELYQWLLQHKRD